MMKEKKKENRGERVGRERVEKKGVKQEVRASLKGGKGAERPRETVRRKGQE